MVHWKMVLFLGFMKRYFIAYQLYDTSYDNLKATDLVYFSLCHRLNRYPHPPSPVDTVLYSSICKNCQLRPGLHHISLAVSVSLLS